MEVWKMIFLFKQVIFRFYVNLQECYSYTSIYNYVARLEGARPPMVALGQNCESPIFFRRGLRIAYL